MVRKALPKMTLKQIQADYIKISRALRLSTHWAWFLHRYGQTDEEREEFKDFADQIYKIRGEFEKLMARPMGRLLQKKLDPS